MKLAREQGRGEGRDLRGTERATSARPPRTHNKPTNTRNAGVHTGRSIEEVTRIRTLANKGSSQINRGRVGGHDASPGWGLRKSLAIHGHSSKTSGLDGGGEASKGENDELGLR